jgi:putative oxygen-independent coproporphyrinogen III oxidase
MSTTPHQTPQQVRGFQPLAFYIHWPFCKAKCPYCDFNSHVRDRVDFKSWKQALLREIEYTKTLTGNHTVTSIFFGGGTPSLMPADIAESAIAKVRELWECDANIEITLEANPTSVEADTFPAFRQAGINRLSIGVQSLRPEPLKFLGREHSTDEAISALILARKYFERYSFDLIYARPQQTLAEWEEELSEALALAGAHISLYQLTIEENTAFHAAYAKGAFSMPSEELAADMYEMTESLTRARNLYAYEVSNYAVPGQESRHNLSYWLGHDYVGIGPGAHGRIGTPRHATLNVKSPERWLSMVSEQGHGQESMLPLSGLNIAEERLMMGLRIKEGVLIAEVCNFISEEKRRLAIREGLLENNELRLIATAKGRLLLTTLSAMLLKD